MHRRLKTPRFTSPCYALFPSSSVPDPAALAIQQVIATVSSNQAKRVSTIYYPNCYHSSFHIFAHPHICDSVLLTLG